MMHLYKTIQVIHFPTINKQLFAMLGEEGMAQRAKCYSHGATIVIDLEGNEIFCVEGNLDQAVSSMLNTLENDYNNVYFDFQIAASDDIICNFYDCFSEASHYRFLKNYYFSLNEGIDLNTGEREKSITDRQRLAIRAAQEWSRTSVHNPLEIN